MLEGFLYQAKVETMARDFNELRRAIRAWNPEAAEAAWDRCERWLGAITPETEKGAL